jgi:hypothetical protein
MYANFGEFFFQVVGTFGSVFLPERGSRQSSPSKHLPRGREVERVKVLPSWTAKRPSQGKVRSRSHPMC